MGSDIAPARNAEIASLAATIVGRWPPDLDRPKYEGNIDRLIATAVKYQTMPHPGFPGYALDYVMIGNKLARRGRPEEDSKLVSTSQWLLRKHGRLSLTVFDPKQTVLAYEVIQEYGGYGLAKLLFLLPRLAEAVASPGGADLIVEDLAEDTYRGVENVLFEIYEELGEGQLFDDRHVTRKLLSLYKRSWQ